MAKRSKVGNTEKPKPEPKPRAEVVVMTGGAVLANRPGFMDALHAFQYGESTEESEAGFRNMVDIASGPEKPNVGE